jgi:transcriptional regulator with XRE-family HTH domain
MNNFGGFIKSMRKAKGLTLEKLAKEIGTEKGYISSIENGKVNPPSADVVREMADALDVGREELLLLAYVQKAPEEIQGILHEGVKLALERRKKVARAV